MEEGEELACPSSISWSFHPLCDKLEADNWG